MSLEVLDYIRHMESELLAFMRCGHLEPIDLHQAFN